MGPHYIASVSHFHMHVFFYVTDIAAVTRARASHSVCILESKIRCDEFLFIDLFACNLINELSLQCLLCTYTDMTRNQLIFN